MAATPIFALLTPPLPSALSIIRLDAELSDLAPLFSRLPEAIDRPVLCRLEGVDEGLLNREAESRWIFTPHGGLGVIEALRAKLLGVGFSEGQGKAAFTDLAPWRERILAALSKVGCEAQAAWLLKALAKDSAPDDLERLIASATRLPLVLLCGAPNAGKSSLFNALAVDREVIVADQAGTTRDLITARIDLGDGLAALLGDTPGLRDDAASKGEAAGIALARGFAKAADLTIWLLSEGQEAPSWPDMAIQSKADLGEGTGVSAKTGQGLEGLRKEIKTRVLGLLGRD